MDIGEQMQKNALKQTRDFQNLNKSKVSDRTIKAQVDQTKLHKMPGTRASRESPPRACVTLFLTFTPPLFFASTLAFFS